MSTTIYHQLQKLLSEGQNVAVATITDVKGSVPREVGAKMIIHPYGKHVGTIGGGCGEADVIRMGLDVIQDGLPRNVQVDLTEEINRRLESNPLMLAVNSLTSGRSAGGTA